MVQKPLKEIFKKHIKTHRVADCGKLKVPLIVL